MNGRTCPRCHETISTTDKFVCGMCNVEERGEPIVCALNDAGEIIAYGVYDSLRERLGEDATFCTVPANALRRMIKRQGKNVHI